MQIQLIAWNFKQWPSRHEKCFIKILISIPAMCARMNIVGEGAEAIKAI